MILSSLFSSRTKLDARELQYTHTFVHNHFHIPLSTQTALSTLPGVGDYHEKSECHLKHKAYYLHLRLKSKRIHWDFMTRSISCDFSDRAALCKQRLFISEIIEPRFIKRTGYTSHAIACMNSIK